MGAQTCDLIHALSLVALVQYYEILCGDRLNVNEGVRGVKDKAKSRYLFYRVIGDIDSGYGKYGRIGGLGGGGERSVLDILSLMMKYPEQQMMWYWREEEISGIQRQS